MIHVNTISIGGFQQLFSIMSNKSVLILSGMADSPVFMNCQLKMQLFSFNFLKQLQGSNDSLRLAAGSSPIYMIPSSKS
jgi:hypothetical protein